MFAEKIVNDLQQVIEVCGRDCHCCKSLTIFTTNINDLQQVIDNLYYKHQ
jgi:hypothetical protein